MCPEALACMKCLIFHAGSLECACVGWGQMYTEHLLWLILTPWFRGAVGGNIVRSNILIIPLSSLFSLLRPFADPERPLSPIHSFLPVLPHLVWTEVRVSS